MPPDADASAPDTMSIGDVAQRSGTPITTLRYYERRGLIDPPARVGGQRRYGPAVLMRLMLIRFCRIAGLNLDDIALVIADRSPQRRETKRIAEQHMVEIDRQLDQARLARRMMEAVVRCTCPTVDECRCGAMRPVVDDLLRLLDGG